MLAAGVIVPLARALDAEDSGAMSATEPSRTPERRAVEPGERAVAPFRRPQVPRQTVALGALWVLGGLVGTALPALIVPPTSTGLAVSRVLLAFSLTVVGVAVMAFACLLLYRRTKDRGVLVFALVPTGVLLAGGMMMLGTQLFA